MTLDKDKQAQDQDIWPVEIRCNSARDRLTVRFEQGADVDLSREHAPPTRYRAPS